MINKATAFRIAEHRWLGSRRRLLWTYTPETHGLESLSDATVYHCVDLLGKVPGISEDRIVAAEASLARKGVLAIASSKVVYEHLHDVGFERVLLWENVADVAPITESIEQCVRKNDRVIFAGNLSPLKVDFDLLIQLSSLGVDVCVAGPRAEGGGSVGSKLHELASAGVTDLGHLEFDRLAIELASSSVGLIPYLDNDYTRGVSPLKTYEYAAAGLPIVSSDLPGVTPHSDLVFRESDRRAFIERTLTVLRTVTPDQRRRLVDLAEKNSWSRRGIEIRDLAVSLLNRSDSHDEGSAA